MLKALAGFIVPSAFAGALADADYRLELSRNKELRGARTDDQEALQRMAHSVHERLRLLRRRMLQGAICVVSAVVVALAVSGFVSPTCLRSPAKLFTLISVFLFAWATLGRLGWAGQSYKGDTLVERLDQTLFWSSYWLATFFAVLAAA